MILITDKAVDEQQRYDSFSGATAKEIKFLLKVIKAQANMIAAYRLGKTKLPQWVFETMENARMAGLIS